MAFINGQWVDDELMYGGTFDAPGSMGDWNPPPLPPTPPNWTQGPPFMPGPQPPFGDRPGMPNQPPQMNPPGYSRGPQMQSPFGGGLGDIDQWNPIQTPEWQPFPQPPQLPTQPPQMMPSRTFYSEPQMPSPQVRPPMPAPPPNISDVWQPEPVQARQPMLDLIDTGPQDTRTQQELNAADHAFNVAQRERTKVRLAGDRAKTKKHYAKLRAKGSSPQTIAKAKAKSKARGAKIKAQHPSRKSTIIYD